MTSDESAGRDRQTEAFNNVLSVFMAIVGTLLSILTLLYAFAESRPEFILVSVLLWGLVAFDPDVGRWRHVWD